MPGFVTHYLFGEEIYHQLKCNSQKKNLSYNRSAYAFGLQGPRICFSIIFRPMPCTATISVPSHTPRSRVPFSTGCWKVTVVSRPPQTGALPKPTSPVSWDTICSTPHAIPISMP